MFTFIIRYAEKADSTCNDIVEDIVVIDIGNSSIFEGSFCKEHLGNCWEVTYSLHFEECAKREMFVSLLDCFDLNKLSEVTHMLQCMHFSDDFAVQKQSLVEAAFILYVNAQQNNFGTS